MKFWPSKNKPRLLTTPQDTARRWRLFWALVVIVGAAGLGYYAALRDKMVVAHAGEAAAALSADAANQLASSSMQRDGDARVNILLLGKGGDGHEGGNLTDTIQVLSVDTFGNQAAIMSIPRDMFVKTEVGEMKINAVYSTANGKNKDSGGPVMKDLVGQITDLSIHYFVTLDFTGFYSFIDLIGGITVNVETAINDTQYPKEDGSGGVTTFILPAGRQHLDGETALKFVRSRHSSGREGSDFARSARQQQVIVAVKEKVLNEGLLANPLKFVKTLNLISDNIKTDITASDLKLMVAKLADINTDQLKTAVLSNSPEGLLTDADNFAGYTLIPRLGYGKYEAIQRRLHSLAPDPLVTWEKAPLRVVYTAASQEETARETADLLRDYGYNVIATEMDSAAKPGRLVVYQRANTEYTINYLAKRYNLPVETGRGNDGVSIDLVLAAR